MTEQRRDLRTLLLVIAGVVLALASLRIGIQGGWTVQRPTFLDPEMNQEAPALAGQASWALLYTLLMAVPLIGGLWLSAAGLGWPLRRLLTAKLDCGPFAAFVAQAGLGMAALLQINWLIAWAGWLNATTAWCLIAAGLLLLGWQATRWYLRTRPEYFVTPTLPWTLLLSIPAIALLAVACVCPPGTLWAVEARAYDVMSYHLQVPREWLAQGYASGLHHNVYSYLPNLIESAYMLIGAAKGSVYDAIYFTQLFHASAAVWAAVTIGCIARRFVGAVPSAVAAAAFLAIPWTLITGSLAYNEMFVIGFGACALLVLLGSPDHHIRAAAAAGFLVGAATLAKLTGSAMIALPIGLIILLRLNRQQQNGSARPSLRSVLVAAAAAAIVGAATLVPWMGRNALDTGNPVFPFATKAFGTGHWTPELVQRWHSSHDVDATAATRLRALGQQWLCNTGYGSPFGAQRVRETSQLEAQNVARFDTEWGIPLLWVFVAAASVLAITHRPTRSATTALLLMLAVQLLFWLFFTHLQSRFLVPTLLPACALLGLGMGVVDRSPRKHFRWEWPVAAVVLVAVFTSISFGVLQRQTVGLYHNGKLERFAAWQIMHSLLPPEYLDSMPGSADEHTGAGDHEINSLQPDTRTLLVADAARLIYIRRPFVYNSAFDANPLGKLIRKHDGNPAAVTSALRAAGFTHVWLHWQELDRLRSTYGFDQSITQEQLKHLIDSGRWHRKWAHPTGLVELYRLP